VIVAEPEDTPVTVPVSEPIAANELLLLLHVPPPASVSVIEEPTQVLVIPAITAGSAFMVIPEIAIQPVGSV
jgi:hypothetical protein